MFKGVMARESERKGVRLRERRREREKGSTFKGEMARERESEREKGSTFKGEMERGRDGEIGRWRERER